MMMMMGREYSMLGRKMLNAYRILGRKPEMKRPPGSLMHRWEDNIKMHLKEIGFEDVNWIKPAQDRFKWGLF
jgi:hypothetical protein